MIIKAVVTTICIVIFSIMKNFGQGLEIYLVKRGYPNFHQHSGDCLYCFTPSKSELYINPLIKQPDIEYFDWDNQTLCLKNSAISALRNLEIPLQGLAVAITLDKEPVYGFWLWNPVSSFGCDGVLAFVYPNSKNLDIKFGLPKDDAKGTDPRFNDKIKDYLTKINLIKYK